MKENAEMENAEMEESADNMKAENASAKAVGTEKARNIAPAMESFGFSPAGC